MNTYPIYCINLEHRKDRKEYSFTQKNYFLHIKSV